MLKQLLKLKSSIGDTPIEQIPFPGINLFAKIECNNLTGSIKDRAAFYILQQAIKNDLITKESVIVESSSGNFAIALGYITRHLGLSFVSVIDPNISPLKQKKIAELTSNILKVTEVDETSGYLITRLNEVKKLLTATPKSFWTDQYSNHNNMYAHYYGTGVEICNQMNELDYIFVAVSTGGTISGVSKKVKEKFPQLKVIAVDIEGSVIFEQPPRERFIPGLGSSIVPPLIKQALIDDLIIVSDTEIINGCLELKNKHSYFMGGSSGAVYSAVKKYFMLNNPQKLCNVLLIFPDSGDSYLDTIYNNLWVSKLNKSDDKNIVHSVH